MNAASFFSFKIHYWLWSRSAIRQLVFLHSAAEHSPPSLRLLSDSLILLDE
jgi:hypothetical protein